MDGVILLSSEIHERAFRETLASFCPGEFDYRAVAGMRTDEAIKWVLAKNGISVVEEQIGQFAAVKSSRAREAIAIQNPIAPGCREVLDSLSASHRLGLASSASKATIELFLERNGLSEKFECILNGYEVRRAKPAPDIYELCFQRMALAAVQCLVIEDATSGVQAAKCAGATVWGITTTCSAAELRKAGADRTIENLRDLLILKEHQ
jgi:HAD superfamily hydrolase (TIGR01509 family)